MTGSVLAGRDCGAGLEALPARARGFDAEVRRAAPERAFDPDERLALPAAGRLPGDAFLAGSRFSLRRPGRERGRLPNTLGSSGMDGKNTRASGFPASGPRLRWTHVLGVD